MLLLWSHHKNGFLVSLIDWLIDLYNGVLRGSTYGSSTTDWFCRKVFQKCNGCGIVNDFSSVSNNSEILIFEVKFSITLGYTKF